MTDTPQDKEFLVVNEFVKMSPKIDLVASALSTAQGAMGAAEKSSTNPHFRSKYADINSVIDASKEALAANGLSVIQLPSANPPFVRITTIIMHKSGQWISGELTLKADADTAQKVGSAVTYGRRYALTSILLMGAEDDDGNLANQRAPQNTQTPQSKGAPLKDVGDYKATFGKYKDVALKAIHDDDICNYMDYLVEGAKKAERQLSGDSQAWFQHAQDYIDSLPSKAPVGPMAHTAFDDDMPF